MLFKGFGRASLPQYMWTIEGNKRQRAIAEEIISRWPENPAGYFLSGLTYWRDIYLDPTKSREDSLKKAMELAQKALAKGGDSYSQTHVLLSAIYASNGDYDKSFAEAKGLWTLIQMTLLSFIIMPLVFISQDGTMKLFQYFKNQSASTPSVHPMPIIIWVVPMHGWAGERRRFLPGSRQFS